MLSTILAGALALTPPPSFDASETYNEVQRITAERFLDPDMNGVDWAHECDTRRDDAAQARTPAQLAAVVNDLLGTLNTSHTAMYPKGSRAWAEILDVFFDDTLWDSYPADFVELPVHYTGAGIVTRTIEGRVFVADLYPGTASEDSGLVVGDEIVRVAGARWDDAMPWPGKPGEPVDVVYRRAESAAPMTTVLAGERLRPDDVFVEAQRRSARVIERNGQRIGYVRFRTGAGDAYADLLREQMLWGVLKDCDALVLDIRGGWGGASISMVSQFDPETPRVDAKRRDGEWVSSQGSWIRPLVLLIDGGARSGKEIMAHALQRSGRATLVGETTAGAVVGGSPSPLPDGSVLYVAVMDVRVDGEKLEGAGVAPDIEVGFELLYSAGHDPQLERAIEVAVERARANG